MFLSFGAIVFGSIVYANRDEIDKYMESLVVSKVKQTIHHELNQPHVIEMCNTNLKRVVWKFVLENPQVQLKTIDLLDQLLHQDRSFKVTLDLMKKAMRHPPVINKLTEQALGRTRQFVEDPVLKDQAMKGIA